MLDQASRAGQFGVDFVDKPSFLLLPEVIENGVIDGFWVESASDYTCDTAKMGSRHWGRIRFELNSARTAWTGIWSYCDYEYLVGNVWNGKRAAK